MEAQREYHIQTLSEDSSRRPERSSQIELNGLAAAIEDARLAALDSDTGPADPQEYHSLLVRLESVRTRLPPLYRDSVVEPFIATLNRLGEAGFSQTLHSGLGELMTDIAHVILQQGEGYASIATDAFQEVVSDLWDGFLSAEDRRGVKPPDHEVIAPLIKWGNPHYGPYTWPIEATSTFGIRTAIVSLPPANARRGLLAWSTAGHETAGHDVLHADEGLRQELADHLYQAITPLGAGLADYWASRIDETASDVLGILNMGPAAGIGLIGYFRALSSAYGGDGKLRSNGPAGDPHPADILRGFLAAEVVALLLFSNRAAWSKAIENETLKDLGEIVLAGELVSSDIAQQSARIVAQTLVSYKANSLEGHSLGAIQNWRNYDELRVSALRVALRTALPVPPALLVGTYAAHAVAAGVVEIVSDGRHIPMVFTRMLGILKAMHNRNPSWGPLFVKYPGAITRQLGYLPQEPTNGSLFSASEAEKAFLHS